MDKKVYMKPEAEVVKIETVGMLAASGTKTAGFNPTDSFESIDDGTDLD